MPAIVVEALKAVTDNMVFKNLHPKANQNHASTLSPFACCDLLFLNVSAEDPALLLTSLKMVNEAFGFCDFVSHKYLNTSARSFSYQLW